MREVKVSVVHPETKKRTEQIVLVGEQLQYDYSDSKWIALDTETLGLDIHRDPVCSVQIASRDDKSKTGMKIEILYTYSGPKGRIVSTDQGKGDYPGLKRLLTNPKIEKIVHVFSFDIPRIENLIQDEIKGRVWDTKIMSRVGRSNTPNHGLNSLLKTFFHVEKIPGGDASDWILPYKDWSETQIKYAAMDVLYLYELKKRLLDRVQRAGREKVLMGILDCIPAVSLAIRSGFDHAVFAYNG